MDKHEWIRMGVKNKWCTAPICYTHDGLPTTEYEEKLFDMGLDPCVHIIRPYSSTEEMDEIIQNHPSALTNESYFE